MRVFSHLDLSFRCKYVCTYVYITAARPLSDLRNMAVPATINRWKQRHLFFLLHVRLKMLI